MTSTKPKDKSDNKISQAMILAAGKGTRLRPLTLTTPKPLVKVGGIPLIIWHIKSLRSAGINDIVINTSWLSDKLIGAVGDGSEYGVNIKWSIEPEEPLETAGGISKAIREGLLKDEPFILINGDIWTDFDLLKLTHYQMSPDQKAHLLLVENPTHNPNGDFSIQNGLASEKTVAGSDKYTFSGISVMSPSLVEDVVVGQVAALAPFLKQAMLKLQVTAELLEADWVDVGTPERLEILDSKLSKK